MLAPSAVDDLQTLADLMTARVSTATPRLDGSLLRAARDHDIEALLYRALHDAGVWDRQSELVRRRLAEAAARAVLIEQIRGPHIRATIDALDAVGVPALIFKGTALAYRYYPEPWLRPRVDTDVFVRHHDHALAERTFERLGLSRALKPRGTRVTHQQTYQVAVGGVVQRYDVHWRISDPVAFADAFTFEELARCAEARPEFGAARTVGGAHALLIACAHRVAHHFDTESLLWLYDIDLIARSLSDESWSEFASMAIAKRLRQVCARGLELTRRRFDTPVPPKMMEMLASGTADEPSAAYLRGGLRRVDVLTSDLQALGWRDRMSLLREHLFPERSYIVQRYGRRNAALLPVLYVHRIVRGAVTWFRPLR